MLDSLRGLDMPVGRAFGWGSDPEQWLVLSPALESSNGRLGGSRLDLKGLGGLGSGEAAYPLAGVIYVSPWHGNYTVASSQYATVPWPGVAGLKPLRVCLEPAPDWLCLDILPRGDRAGPPVDGSP